MGTGQPFDQILGKARQFLTAPPGQPVTRDSCRTSDCKPFRTYFFWSFEKSCHHCLMISFEVDGCQIFQGLGDETVNNIGRSWPAVDVVAKIDDQILFGLCQK